MKYQTLKEANYKYMFPLGSGAHVLKDLDNEKLEVFYSNKNHASWGIIYKNTHLEFARSYKPEMEVIKL